MSATAEEAEKEAVTPKSESDGTTKLVLAVKSKVPVEKEALDSEDDSTALTQVIPTQKTEETGAGDEDVEMESDTEGNNNEKDAEEGGGNGEAVDDEEDEDEEEKPGIRVVNLNSLHEQEEVEDDEDVDEEEEVEDETTAKKSSRSKASNGRSSENSEASEIVTRKRAASLTASGDGGPKPKLGRSTSNLSVRCT